MPKVPLGAPVTFITLSRTRYRRSCEHNRGSGVSRTAFNSVSVVCSIAPGGIVCQGPVADLRERDARRSGFEGSCCSADWHSLVHSLTAVTPNYDTAVVMGRWTRSSDGLIAGGRPAGVFFSEASNPVIAFLMWQRRAGIPLLMRTFCCVSCANSFMWWTGFLLHLFLE